MEMETVDMGTEAGEMLARIDERTTSTNAMVLRIDKRVDELESKMDAQFVTQAEFAPIKKLIYGAVGLILVAVMGALITLVVKK